MLEFETITYAPIDLRLIDANMLTRKEKNWLNAYHQAVYSKLSPILAGPIIHWLAQATAEI